MAPAMGRPNAGRATSAAPGRSCLVRSFYTVGLVPRPGLPDLPRTDFQALLGQENTGEVRFSRGWAGRP
eukprot:12429795-Heterocapsa_arctica.AAC.1